jgi:hypothetical protein
MYLRRNESNSLCKLARVEAAAFDTLLLLLLLLLLTLLDSFFSSSGV